jgi:peptide/nickel transport system substrate-binding protein
MVQRRGPTRRQLFERTFLSVAGVAGVSLLTACGQQAPSPAPTSKPAAAATTAPTAKPAAPAGATPAGAAATPASGTQTAAAGATTPTAKPDQQLGAQLIGKLEGPTVITDPAQYPKSFKEAPQLAELVKTGKLPPVDQRVSQDPLVIKPVREIGKYGGVWRRGFTGPGDKWNGYRAGSGPDHVLFWEYTGNTIVPNIAKAWSFEDGGKTLVVTLRKDMKWSDGEPFTADDFVFWFEDIYSNQELLPSGDATMRINGKPGKIEKGDEVTVKYVFPDPYYLVADMLAGSTPLASQSQYGLTFMGSFAPAHYLKQFHPKYVGADQADKLAKDAGFDNWVSLLKLKNDWATNPDLPVVSPWKTVKPINTPQWELERNPYSIWVDTDGNQLPYIDKIQFNLAENLEIINLRAIAGEFDWQARHIDAGKIPVILENQDKGNYKLHLDPGDYGADCVLKFNLSYEADAELGKWFRTVDFRRALSLGIDRDQLNETFWLGLGTPGSLVPRGTNKYNPGPEYRTLWHTYDPNKANQMLDALGLTKKDSGGYRMRLDGQDHLRIEIQTEGGQFLQYTQIAEMIRDQYKAIGIDVAVQENERTLAERRNSANENQMFAWVADGSEHLYTFPTHIFPYDLTGGAGALYAQWFQSGGKQGKEPPEELSGLKRVYQLYLEGFGVPEDKQVANGKEIWKLVTDQVFSIGTVGLSPASMGIRIVSNKLGNVPDRQYNSPDGKTPGISRPVTFYFKS